MPPLATTEEYPILLPTLPPCGWLGLCEDELCEFYKNTPPFVDTDYDGSTFYFIFYITEDCYASASTSSGQLIPEIIDYLSTNFGLLYYSSHIR